MRQGGRLHPHDQHRHPSPAQPSSTAVATKLLAVLQWLYLD
jgi:hypothetical protein